MNIFRIAAWLVLGGCAGMRAQETPPISSKGEEVLLDVIVRDKKGGPVNALTQGDFTVFDDGVQKPIKAFRLVKGKEAFSPTGEKKQLDPLSQIRLVSLVFGRMDAAGRVLSRQAALDFLRSDLPDNVHVGVFVLDQSLEALQNFTNDRAALVRAVEKASTGAYSEFGGVSMQMREQIQTIAGPNIYGAQSLEEQVNGMSTGGSSTTGPDPTSAAAAMFASMMLQMVTFSERAEVTQSGRAAIYALLAAVQAQSQLPGRKALIYFTSGFTIPQGAQEAFQSVISAANRNNLSFYPVDSRGLTTVGTDNTTQMNGEAVSHLVGAAASSRANGQGTPIGDNHVTTQSALVFDEAMDAGKLNMQDNLGILADATGGFLTANTNDFRGPVKRIVEDLDTYYEISYDPQLTVYDGKFHHVAVKTGRGDYRVQSREGYFALPHSGKGALSAFEIPLLRALAANPPKQAFPFESDAMHFRGEGRAMTCGFLLEMQFIDITMRENPEKGRLNGGVAYVVLVKDSRGEIVKKLQGDVPVDITADQAAPFKQSRFTDLEYFDIPPGRYVVETALLDKESGQTSARRSSLIVPKINSGLAMSSMALIRKWRAKEPDASPDDPFVVGDKTVTPTLAPRINKSVSTALPFYVTVYPDSDNSNPLSLTLEFNRDGKVKRLATATLGPADAQGRIQYAASAPIDQFDPGNYSIRCVVKQGAEVAEESFAIVLEP